MKALILLFLAILAVILYSNDALSAGMIAFTSYMDGNYDIYIMDEDGNSIERITEDPIIDMSPSWSSDGNMIVFLRRKSGIYTVKLDERRPRLVISGSFEYPLLSPDGTKIAFVETILGINIDMWLCVVDVNGENQKRLKKLSDMNDRPHSWSPDSKQLVFCDNRKLYVIDVWNKNWNLINCNIPALDVDWSPIGDKLAVASFADTQGIWIVNNDGTGTRRITNEGDRNPEWSPDSSKIAFHSSRDGDLDIYVMDSDGQNIKCLTQNETVDMEPAWVDPAISINSYDELITTWGHIKISVFQKLPSN